MSSFVLSRFPVPYSIYLSAQVLLAPLSVKEKRFVLHVLVSNVINLGKLRHHQLDGWIDLSIDLPSKWIIKHFGSHFRPKALLAKIPSLLVISPYSTKRHRCQSFKVSDALLDLVVGGSPTGSGVVGGERVVNLFDGSDYAVQAPKEWDHGVYRSKVIHQAIRCFGGCPFNGTALDRHLEDFDARVRQATGDEHHHLERAFQNDNACAMRIRAGCRLDQNGFGWYQPEFRTSYTGRIVEVGGATQSCSRDMKEALFLDVPGVRNYDLKAAQAFVLLQELEDAGLPREWLGTYLADPHAAATRAAALAISKDAYKRCLYATIMGSPHSTYPSAKENKIYAVLLREVAGDAAAKAKMREVYAALTDLKREVDAWHQHLMNDTACRHVDPGYRKIRTLRNACGQHFKLDASQHDLAKLPRKAAAFILQGQEAGFIHRLTVLGKDFGFTPVSNRHDGIVVLGEIPKAAVERAAEAAGLRYAKIEVKPFV